jgi:UDP-glucose 4-epimerase
MGLAISPSIGRIQMAIMVTGGAGFIGSQLVDELLAKGDEVRVLDDFSSGRMEFVAPHKDDKRFKLAKVDIRNLSAIKKLFKDCDTVYHLAANPDARRGITNTRLDLELETEATYNVLESMRLSDVKEIVFSSSGTIYGETPVRPIAEDYGPVLPISLYGAGKLASEGLISAFCGTFGLKAWIYRFANVVGPRMTHGVIFDLVNKIEKDKSELEVLGDGTQNKPYIHVSDCISGMFFGKKASQDQLNVLNLGVESTTAVSEIAEKIISEMGLRDCRIRYSGSERGWPGDVPQFRFDVKKMTQLGWKVKYSSGQAVAKAVRELLDERKRK